MVARSKILGHWRDYAIQNDGGIEEVRAFNGFGVGQSRAFATRNDRKRITKAARTVSRKAKNEKHKYFQPAKFSRRLVSKN